MGYVLQRSGHHRCHRMSMRHSDLISAVLPLVSSVSRVHVPRLLPGRRSTGVPDLQALGLLGPRPAALSDQQGGSTVSGSRDANTHAPRAVRFDAHNGGGNGGDNGGGGGSGGGPAVLSAVPRLTQLLHGLPVARPGLRVHPAKGRALVFWWVGGRPGAATGVWSPHIMVLYTSTYHLPPAPTTPSDMASEEGSICLLCATRWRVAIRDRRVIPVMSWPRPRPLWLCHPHPFAAPP